ncbi:hypothetical protein CLAFUW4_05233 [Fulvia fulva]|uniref:AB hydrolase-1 domain-containing protein n=1 Tax=Passalora fulva TaxID=5499 RepID=A0A9Q8UUL1_PASFU|nr:uncharacterized protein CLAFUR5_11674 [Fulvia fulva]KAK4626233.1 hypothetical protein CLAFUR4_05219 [Fulvia fulva]KAK4628654.1 hypothetical protein CLAFUR0_05225 [Fulvia fulva]UJO23018.1 hypothetical protein CLAFUR5_11674 [Fulvia fulva]WPV13182.1 hypothetical protein CLAFUW4_05233 [Fulvia fulva]WPV29310.1 hypothetical protein CLAFUW7_05229 [Fulvia fulva]
MALSDYPRAVLTACLALLPLLGYKIYQDYIKDDKNAIKAKQLGDTLRAQLGRECRFRLDNDTSATITLPDYRKLGCAEYGQPDGKPIIMLHGLPGSRLEMAWQDEYAKKIGARIIGVDRPGVGWSSPHPGRTHLSFAQDIKCLTDALQLDQYAVIGTSGGGPYVMACAAYLPANRLKAIANVTGMGDIQRYKSTGMGWPNWLGYRYIIHWAPWFFRWHSSRYLWPKDRLHLSEEEKLRKWIDEIATPSANPKDLDAWAASAGVDLLRLAMTAGQEYFQDGFDTLIQDATLLGSKWDFRVEDIRPDLPMHLWFGKQDKNVSVYHGVEIAKRFRGKARLHYLDETHLSLQVRYFNQILDDLVAEF